ncbi:MAG: ABC transporter substrate-binding protein [Acidimicrobiia bacterium]|nr:ABC transporter substrate-binding protein [Acidimicrobiia bacterium]
MLRRRHGITALLVVLVLGAAACTSDDGDEEASADGDNSTTAGSVATTTVAEDTTTTTSMPEEVELTASFRGVTADTITVGYSSIDFDRLNSEFGLDLAFQNFGPQADAIVGWYNDNGGVLGRRIELVHERYLPVGSTTAEEVCIKLTEDATVFAVLAGFAGPGAADVNECVAEQHDTVLVATAPRADQAERARGLWVSSDMSLDRRNAAVAQLMADAGVLGDLGAMMVIGSNGDEQPLVDGMAEALTDVGVDVPITDVVTTTGDRIATAADVSVWIERAQAEGVSTVVLLGEGEFRNQEFFEQAPEFTYIMGNGDAITDWQSIPPEGLQAGTRVLTNNNGPDVDLLDDPRIGECIAAVEQAQGVEVIPTSQLPEGDPNYFSGTVGVCRTVALFVQIAEAAGPDLTNESWVAALDEVPDLSVPGYDFVSLSSTKVDARDQLVLVEFDLETLSFDPISDPVDVG